MLRITRLVGDDSVETLKLEGKLQGAWVVEALEASLSQRPRRPAPAWTFPV